MKLRGLKPAVSRSEILHFDFVSVSFESPERSEGSGQYSSLPLKGAEFSPRMYKKSLTFVTDLSACYAPSGLASVFFYKSSCPYLIHSAAFSFGKLWTLRRRILSNVEVKPRPLGQGRTTPLSVSNLRQTSGFSSRLYEGLIIFFCTSRSRRQGENPGPFQPVCSAKQ